MDDEAERRAELLAHLDLVGGLLLGAAAVALILLFVPLSAWQPEAALLASLACFAAARAAERARGERAAEAAFATALAMAGAVPFFAHSPPPLAAVAALVAVSVTLARRGRSPLALVAVPVFYVDARHATGADLLRGSSLLAEIVLLVALLAMLALLVRQRSARWAGIALAAQGIALTTAVFPLLDALGVRDGGIAALAAGAMLGALFAFGLALRTRPLVATTGALLAAAAAAFAFLALGPELAALVLLCSGAALVWKAEAVRGYFRAPS